MFLSFWIAAVLLSEIWNKPYNTSSPNLISENVDVCLFVAKYINPISQCVYMFVCRYCDVILYLRNIYIYLQILLLTIQLSCLNLLFVRLYQMWSFISCRKQNRIWPDLWFNANNCPCRHWRQCVYCYRVCKWIIHPISTYFVLQTEKWYNSALQFTRTTRRDVMSCTATIKDFSMKRPRKFCRHALDEFQNESGTKLSPELESDL